VKGLRGALAAALGLALMELVLSSSEKGGPASALLNSAFSYPAKWVEALVNPATPAVPDLSHDVPIVGSSTTHPLGNGLSGTGQPSGTGSNTIKI
jgi:hypothetical protein